MKFYILVMLSLIYKKSVQSEGVFDQFHMKNSIVTDPVQSGLRQLGIKKEPGDYNIHTPPPVGLDSPVPVHISISLRNILDIDEVRQLLTVETTLRLYWQDTRLKVNHLLQQGDGGNGHDYILVHPDTVKYIWVPDIYIDFAKALRAPGFLVAPASLRIYRNSTLRYASQINYDVACPMSFQKYPHDTQICKVKFESYGHTTQRMEVKWKRGFDASKVTDNNSISLAQFDYAVSFEEEYQEAIASGEYPGVIMTIALRRKLSYHLLQTFLPSALFVIVAWLSLFLPPESIPGRIAMSMTTLLTLAAMFGAVRQNTPRVSYVTSLDIWMCACVIFVFLILLEYVIVLWLIHNKKLKDEEEEHELFQASPEENEITESDLTTDRSCFNQILPNGKTRHVIHTTEESKFLPNYQKREVKKYSDAPRKKRVRRVPVHVLVERCSRYMIAILFVVFNGVYWTILLWEEDIHNYLPNSPLYHFPAGRSVE